MSVDDLPVTTAPTRATSAPAAAPEAAVEPARGPAPAPAPSGGWGLPLVVLIVGMFMSILDTSIVNVAIPTIQNEFGATTDERPVDRHLLHARAWAWSCRSAPGSATGSARAVPTSCRCWRSRWARRSAASRGTSNSMIVFRIIQAIPGGILPVVTPDDGVPDRAAGEDRHGHGHVRARHHRRARRSARRWAATWSSTSTGG